MLKIFADFNSRTPDDGCFVLRFEGKDLEEQIDALGLKPGDRVVLYRDEDDFEVVATLSVEYVDQLERNAWLARPDMSTFVRKQNPA